MSIDHRCGPARDGDKLQPPHTPVCRRIQRAQHMPPSAMLRRAQAAV
ncbi:hypothetical protein L7D48_18635 [Streptomyces sp. S1A]|nr:hypothetical protein [Streptomyces sp. ICN903]MCG3042564.1 hypothetical protein [Streptomyces sp. ICN903]